MNTPKPIPFVNEGPQPLIREIPAGLPYPVEALGPLRAAVEAVQGMTQAPVAIPAGSALAAASLAVQGFADVETLGGKRPLSVFVLTIAASGERKSSCDAPLMAPIEKHEAKQAEAYEAEMKVHLRETTAYNAKKKGIEKRLGESSKAKLIIAESDLAELGDAPTPPLIPQRTSEAPTLSGQFKAFQLGQPSLGLVSDEAGKFLGGHGMQKDAQMETFGGLNKLWDGAPIKRTQVQEGVYTLRGRRMTLHLMMQHKIAEGLLGSDLAVGSGFLPRCLICEPLSTMGTRLSKNEKRNQIALTSFSVRLMDILETPMPVLEDGQTLQPRLLYLSKSARKLLVKYSDEVELELAPKGFLAHITGAASKAAEQAARISGVLTLWKDLNAKEVTKDTMQDAVTLAQFYISEASRLTEASKVSSEIAMAEKLRNWLRDEWQHAHILPRDILRLGPNSLRDSKKVKVATDILKEHGWLIAVEAGIELADADGIVAKRNKAWKVVRS